jgi:copper chaperone
VGVVNDQTLAKGRNMMATVKIKGMSCKHCVMAVQKALSGINGVKNLHVDIDTGEARFEESAPVDMNAVREAIKKAGYQVV